MTPQTILQRLDRLGYGLEINQDKLRITPPQQGHDASLIDLLRTHKVDVMALIAARQESAMTLNQEQDYFPLAEMQQAYFLGRRDELEGGGISSHVYHEIDGLHLDLQRLEDALYQLVIRHPTLRTQVTADGMQTVMNWPNQAWPGIRHHDLRQMDQGSCELALDSIRSNLSHQVMPIERGLWIDVHLASLPNGQQILFVSHDGLAVDGISMLLLFRDWQTLYSASGLDALSSDIAYQKYVIHKQNERRGAVWERSKNWWTARLDAGFPSHPQLPLKQQPNSSAMRKWCRHMSTISTAQYTTLQQFARGKDLSMTAVVLAAWCDVLALWGAGNSFALNVTIADRPPLHPDIYQMVGNFTSNTLLAVEQRVARSFVERAFDLQRQLHQDLEYRAFSGLEVMRELTRRDSAARMPFTFNSTLGHAVEGLNGTSQFGPVLASVSQTPQVWLNVFVMEQDGTLQVQIDAVDALFPDGMVDAMVAALQDALRQLAVDEQNWGEQQLVSIPHDQATRRVASNATATAIPQQTLYEAFLAAAQKNPERLAVWSSERQLDYAQLLRRSAEVEQWLTQFNLVPGRLVGVIMHKGWQQIVAILGILRAGAAYLPIDPGMPPARIASILHSAGVAQILTTQDVASQDFMVADASRNHLCVDQLHGLSSAPEWQKRNCPGDLAYVIYTSGSTGNPKGVMIAHSNVTNLVSDIHARYKISANDVLFGISSFTFDLSVFDIFGALFAGATLVLPDHDKLTDVGHWLTLATQTGVTIWNSVPAIVQMLLDEASGNQGLPRSLRHILMSGDRIPVTLPKSIRAQHDAVEIHSLGGPTETTVWNIYFPIDELDANWVRIPYGKPNSNNRYYILDQNLRNCPDWVNGELFAAGSGNSMGYWEDPKRTAESFFYHVGLQEHLYRTGDTGCFLPNGNIDISGRSDFQIKLNGFRIEAGEIETLISRTPGVRDCAVVLIQNGVSQSLVAYITQCSNQAVECATIASLLNAQLPTWMVPHHFILIENLPLTGNGKVDRKALSNRPLIPVAAIDNKASITQAVVVETGLSERIAAIWHRFLPLFTGDNSQDFYLVGGDSLIMARVAGAFRKEFGMRVSLGDLSRLRTILDQAIFLQGKLQS
ncbi:pyochelin synthetase [Oxalobacteraceae bacterium GrIS 1.11]